jgi:hypothetical protein
MVEKRLLQFSYHCVHQIWGQAGSCHSLPPRVKSGTLIQRF